MPCEKALQHDLHVGLGWRVRLENHIPVLARADGTKRLTDPLHVSEAHTLHKLRAVHVHHCEAVCQRKVQGILTLVDVGGVDLQPAAVLAHLRAKTTKRAAKRRPVERRRGGAHAMALLQTHGLLRAE